MMGNKTRSGSDLFIVDNSDKDWKVLKYLRDWCELSQAADIATGFFEIGSLLAMDEEWQKVDKIRILMGDETSRRTKNAFFEGLINIKNRLDNSIEAQKEKNDFLTGVPAIVEGIRSGKIQCRVYRKEKFHAKAYITSARQAVIGSFALVGSSNFTLPGLTENVELNVQITGRQVNALQEWYEEHWNQAEDITPEILQVIERHIKEYTPFEVYCKSLQEFFRGHEMTPTEWEQTKSKMFPILDQYQKEGYQTLMKIAHQYGSSFLCDGVGAGKTFIGLMLIERLIMHDRKRVALFVPKSARADVWERDLKKYLSHLGGLGQSVFSSLHIFNHTDLGRGGNFPADLQRVNELADVIVIDEAHHFRNPGITGTGDRKPSRYRYLYDLIESSNGIKQIFFLTATPINNHLSDFRHMMELFTRQQDNYFAKDGIHSLRGHFIKMERELKEKVQNLKEEDVSVETNIAEASKILSTDTLFQNLVVQRSRGYIKQSQIQEGEQSVIFPTREPPIVVPYSVKKTYGKIIEMVEKAFEKKNPLFVLGIYYPLYYYKGARTDIDPFTENRQKQVVGLIRTQFLKRFESSVHSFECSCDRLLIKLLAWVEKHCETEHEKLRLERWKQKHAELIKYVHQYQIELNLFPEETDEDEDEYIITDEILEGIEYLSRDEYRVEDIIDDTFDDLSQIVEFLYELRKFEPKHDDKLKALIELIEKNPILKTQKVLIFSEFADTARHLFKELQRSGIDEIEMVDSTIKDRSVIIRRFAPYYNGSSSSDLEKEGIKEIRILISTDVLSEGLNLQDATRLINYDLHWNPVRLMQRIGRVDRRMNPDTEAQLITDHPEQKNLRGKIAFYNFLPPEELEELLRLYTKVTYKTLCISKTFGIEGKKLFTPEDDFDALKNFNEQYDGQINEIEILHLEYQQILKENPEMATKLDNYPRRLFSGKKHPRKNSKAVFFCYRLPRPEFGVRSLEREDKKDCLKAELQTEPQTDWTEEAGDTKWYIYDIDTEKILEDPAEIADIIRSKPETPRVCTTEQKTLVEIRKSIEKYIKNTYMKKIQAPIGIKPYLKTWMELC